VHVELALEGPRSLFAGRAILQVNAIFGATCLVMLLCLPAVGAFVRQSYTEQAVRWTAMLDHIARNLSSNDALAAKKIAAAWFYLGPCEGSDRDLAIPAGDAISGIRAFDLNPFESAKLEMIGALHTLDFGRAPTEATCRFVLDTANQH
jgi:hypothetical protein